MRILRYFSVLLAIAGGVIFAIEIATEQRSTPSVAHRTALSHDNTHRHHPIPVSLNRGSDVRDGFRGDVHSLLHGDTQLEVAAHWTAVERSRTIDQVFRPLTVAKQHQTYTAREFSAFLPQEVDSVGQLWSLDLDKVAGFLKQFHPRASMHIEARGRRAGPDGAFGILRAMSPTHVEVFFRVHAEFNLDKYDWYTPAEISQLAKTFGDDLWYTPAHLSGRMIVNRKTGTIEYFCLKIPTEKSLNVHLHLDEIGSNGQTHNIVRVDRMELTGGERELVADIKWEHAIEADVARHKLKKVFYKFMDINWVPVGQVLEAARESNKPIFAMVMWGALDDQSC